VFRRISPCVAPCCLRPKSEGSAFGLHSFRGHMGSLALRPGDSLTILLDGFVNRLQDCQFPSSCYSSYGALNFYPGGTSTHCSYQPSLDAHFSGVISHKSVSGECAVTEPLRLSLSALRGGGSTSFRRHRRRRSASEPRKMRSKAPRQRR
jgi:hypothetical protein